MARPGPEAAAPTRLRGLWRADARDEEPMTRGDWEYTVRVYAHESAVSLVEQPSYLHADACAIFDTRDHPSYPTRGSVATISATTCGVNRQPF